MFGSVVIDLVIALALIFLVFSLVTSGLREMVAKVLATRAKELWRALRTLLDDPVTSDFRDLRTVAAVREAANLPKQSQHLPELVEAAAKAMRASPRSRMKASAWRRHVAGVLEPIERVARKDDRELTEALRRTKVRLWRRQPHGNRHFLGLFRAVRRGGERPVVPELPTSNSVAALAAELRQGTKTLTDAINEHPFVRQVDDTWAGYHSRLQRLENSDFGDALVDLVRVAGVGPAVGAAFSSTLQELDDLFPEKAAAEHFWPSIAAGLDLLVGRIESATATTGDVDSAWATINDGIHKVLGDLGELTEEARKRLDDHLESARESLLGLVDNPVQLVVHGAEYLDDTSPIKEVLLRLSTNLTRAQAEVADQLEELSGSVAVWYDNRMSALSTWYRRRSRLVAFGLGLVVVIGFNVDAMAIPQELWRNENVRTLVAAAATDSLLELGECLGAEGGAGQATSDCISQNVDDLVETGLPLGWNVGTDCDGTCDSLLERLSYAVGTGGEGPRGAGAKVIGWLLAAAALSMGASFWFEVLKRTTSVKRASSNTDSR